MGTDLGQASSQYWILFQFNASPNAAGAALPYSQRGRVKVRPRLFVDALHLLVCAVLFLSRSYFFILPNHRESDAANAVVLGGGVHL